MPHSNRIARALSSIAFCMFTGTNAFGWSIDPAINGGVMQQPTSNYYLACYGLSLDLTNKDSSLITRLSYTERPEFNRNGFSEKDQLSLFMAGMTAAKFKYGRVRAFFGGGSASGYVARIADDNKIVLDRRRYQLPGPAAAVEYVLATGRFSVAINHTTFIGYGGKEQTEALVAWPYNFYLLSGGYSI